MVRNIYQFLREIITMLAGQSSQFESESNPYVRGMRTKTIMRQMEDEEIMKAMEDCAFFRSGSADLEKVSEQGK